jgi:hypothetical protein
MLLVAGLSHGRNNLAGNAASFLIRTDWLRCVSRLSPRRPKTVPGLAQVSSSPIINAAEHAWAGGKPATAMKAVRIHQYGGPEVLKYEDAPRLNPAPEDVLIRVHAAAINPVDWKVREGYLRERVKHSLPLLASKAARHEQKQKTRSCLFVRP